MLFHYFKTLDINIVVVSVIMIHRDIPTNQMDNIHLLVYSI